MTILEKRLTFWLMICAGMVLIMIGLGGYTRLSGSGLSIVDWKPISGSIPPLTEASWQEMFQRYQLFPEYQKVNSTMTLAEFKFIYLVEYFHRLWGRLMGLVLLIPTYYAFTRFTAIRSRILLIWLLAGLQGFMGWYMVKSGLVDDPQVSPFRLTIHLVLAITILSLIIKTIFEVRSPTFVQEDYNLRWHFVVLHSLLGLTICYGGLTAGTHAGFIYNTFPDMNGRLYPEELFTLTPYWRDLLYNPATIQFVHRILAFSTLAYGFYVFLSSRHASFSPRIRHICLMIATALSLQVMLGVATVVLQVPIWLGVVHQCWAVVTFSATFCGTLLCGKKVRSLAMAQA